MKGLRRIDRGINPALCRHDQIGLSNNLPATRLRDLGNGHNDAIYSLHLGSDCSSIRSTQICIDTVGSTTKPRSPIHAGNDPVTGRRKLTDTTVLPGLRSVDQELNQQKPKHAIKPLYQCGPSIDVGHQSHLLGLQGACRYRLTANPLSILSASDRRG